jgi:hypothetical protein
MLYILYLLAKSTNLNLFFYNNIPESIVMKSNYNSITYIDYYILCNIPWKYTLLIAKIYNDIGTFEEFYMHQSVIILFLS